MQSLPPMCDAFSDLLPRAPKPLVPVHTLEDVAVNVLAAGRRQADAQGVDLSQLRATKRGRSKEKLDVPEIEGKFASEWSLTEPLSTPAIDAIVASLKGEETPESMVTYEMPEHDLAALEQVEADASDCNVPDFIQVAPVEGMGYGAFCTEDLPKDKVVGIYCGKMGILPAEAYDMLDKSYVFDLHAQLGLSEDEAESIGYPRESGSTEDREGADWHLYVDAADVGNWTRFINHSKHANVCWSKEWIRYGDDGGWKLVIVFRTFKKVKAGHQLLFDYGTEYQWPKSGCKNLWPGSFRIEVDPAS